MEQVEWGFILFFSGMVSLCVATVWALDARARMKKKLDEVRNEHLALINSSNKYREDTCNKLHRLKKTLSDKEYETLDYINKFNQERQDYQTALNAERALKQQALEQLTGRRMVYIGGDRPDLAPDDAVWVSVDVPCYRYVRIPRDEPNRGASYWCRLENVKEEACAVQPNAV